jgi:hypothetical protein
MAKTAGIFAKGAVEYLDALRAVRAFQKEVLGVCRKAYERHRGALARALGLPPADCEERVDPKEYQEFDDSYHTIAVSRRTWPGCEFWLGIQWARDDDGKPEVHGFVSVDFPSANARKQVQDRLKERNLERGVELEDTYSLGLYFLIGNLQSVAAGRVLRRVVREWIRRYRSIGGPTLIRSRVRRR